MGSTERIRNVAKRVAKWARAGHQMVVVPSAMSGETNRLLGLAEDLAPSRATSAYHRELDMLASKCWEMASLGSKVLQIRSVEFADKYKVPLRVISSFTPWDIDIDEEARSGTLITFEEDEKMEQAVLSGIAFNRYDAKVSVLGVPTRQASPTRSWVRWLTPQSKST